MVLGETPRHFNLKRWRYSSLEKFEDAFNTALYLMQTKLSDATFSVAYFNLGKCRLEAASDVMPGMFLGPIALDKCKISWS